jgi:hypothetical protein
LRASYLRSFSGVRAHVQSPRACCLGRRLRRVARCCRGARGYRSGRREGLRCLTCVCGVCVASGACAWLGVVPSVCKAIPFASFSTFRAYSASSCCRGARATTSLHRRQLTCTGGARSTKCGARDKRARSAVAWLPCHVRKIAECACACGGDALRQRTQRQCDSITPPTVLSSGSPRTCTCGTAPTADATVSIPTHMSARSRPRRQRQRVAPPGARILVGMEADAPRECSCSSEKHASSQSMHE